MCANSGGRTRRCNLLGGVHDDIEHVLDCHTVVEEVVRSRDGRCRIGSQVRSGTDLAQEGHVEFQGRYIVSGTSADRNVVSLSSLQKKSHEWIDVVVHRLAPRRRGVQNAKQVSCCGSAIELQEDGRPETVHFMRPGARGTSIPLR